MRHLYLQNGGLKREKYEKPIFSQEKSNDIKKLGINRYGVIKQKIEINANNLIF